MKEWSPWVIIRILCPWVNSRYFIIIIVIIIIININIIKIKRLITVCLILDKGMKSLGQHKNIMSLGQLKLFHYYYYYYCCVVVVLLTLLK